MMDWAKANPLMATALLFLIAFLIWGGVILLVPLIANDWMLKWSLFALLMAGAMRISSPLHSEK
ncbi:MAG: hypothetical protein P8H62_08660 [Henriciella sp.]|jgi:hypothetical protein|nr:hypothetical protein [Henriciella sp.]